MEENVFKKITEYSKSIQPNERISWDKLFLDMTFKIAERSHDAQTKCGAIIVNQDNEIVSTGFNGFFRGAKDDILPNLRPEKYFWMIHAEHNAILNCARQGRSTKGTKVYVTGEPCNNCLMLLIQAGISEVIFTNKNKAFMTKMDPDYLVIRKLILYASNDSIKLKELVMDE